MTSQHAKKWRALGRRARLVGAGFAAAAVLPATASAACTGTQRIVNSGFETGTAPWVQTGVVVKPDQNGINAYGNWYAGLKYNGDTITQTVTLEPGCPNYKLRYGLKVFHTFWTSLIYDKLIVTVTAANGTVWTVQGANNLTETGTLWSWKSIYFPNLMGPTVTFRFSTTQNATYPTHFVMDDVTLRPY